MRDVLHTVLSAAVGALITVLVTAWLMTQGSEPAASARLNWISPSLPDPISVSEMLTGFAANSEDVAEKKTLTAIAEKIRYEPSLIIYELELSNNDNKTLNRVSVQADDPIIALYRTDGSPNPKTSWENFAATNRILIPQLDPKTETKITIVSGNSFRPENAIKVLIDDTLVPLNLERFHSEINSELARFVSDNPWSMIVFLFGLLTIPALILQMTMAMFPQQTRALRLAMASNWELRQLDDFLGFAKIKNPLAFANASSGEPSSTPTTN